MILFLYGEDSFRSRLKLRAIRDKFLARPDAETDFLRLTAPEFEQADLEQAIRSSSFFGGSKLVIVEGLLTLKAPFVEKSLGLLADLPAETVVLFYESGLPDRRTSAFKRLIKLAQSERFDPLEGQQLANWVKAVAEGRGGEISPLVVELLVRRVGPDLWRMDQEIDKLLAYNPVIIAEHVELLVRPEDSGGIFDLVDAIGERRPRRALRIASELRRAGETDLHLLGMIVRQFRIILLIKALQEEGVTQSQLPGRLKIHPFVVSKAIRQVTNFSMESLEGIYERLLETDLRLKTSNTDPSVTLDLMIGELSES